MPDGHTGLGRMVSTTLTQHPPAVPDSVARGLHSRPRAMTTGDSTGDCVGVSEDGPVTWFSSPTDVVGSLRGAGVHDLV